MLDRIRNERERAGVAEMLAQACGEPWRGELHFVEHRLAHLASAFCVGPFAEATVVSVDGCGDFASGCNMQSEASDACVTDCYRSALMKTERLRKLRAAGWKVSNTRDFLKLSDEEALLVELKLTLTDALKLTRKKRGMSQIVIGDRPRFYIQ
jgi:hypothetical protein